MFFSIKIQKCQFKIKFISREFLFVEINIYAEIEESYNKRLFLLKKDRLNK